MHSVSQSEKTKQKNKANNSKQHLLTSEHDKGYLQINVHKKRKKKEKKIQCKNGTGFCTDITIPNECTTVYSCR